MKDITTLTHEERHSLTLEEVREYHYWHARDYRIYRFYARGGRRLIREPVSLLEAQAHCADPETGSFTATKAAGRRRTRVMGAWFDGYERA